MPDVQTVLGPVAPAELGITTPHEHLLVDTRGPYWALPEDPALQAFALEPVALENLGLVRRNFVSSRDNLVLDDADLAADELARFAELGGRTLVELTLPEIGRDVRAMAEISLGTNAKWPIPMLDFAGVPCGIDVRRVVETGIAPAINTGIAHRKAGVGQVGAGIARAPLGCFDAALQAIAEQERSR